MRGVEDLESYMVQMGAQYEALGENVWRVKALGPDMVLSIAGPVVVFRVKVMDLDDVAESKRQRLYRTLLELNVSEMLHGAYGLEGESVVATTALQLENLDFNEFQAAIEDLDLAVSNHYPKLANQAA